jgi:hypothetical protein
MKGETLSSTEREGQKKRVKQAKQEPTVPLMLRPKLSYKECAERVADQIGVKRSQLDPSFYVTGALLAGIERLGKAEMIGTWSRKEVAVHLKNAFTPLFELLYEQDELPLTFALLLARGEPLAAVQQPLRPAGGYPQSFGDASEGHEGEEDEEVVSVEEELSEPDPYLPLLSADAEISLDGFPGGI